MEGIKIGYCLELQITKIRMPLGSLQVLGIEASDHNLDLSTIIFELMGFPKEVYTDVLYDCYNTDG